MTTNTTKAMENIKRAKAINYVEENIIRQIARAKKMGRVDIFIGIDPQVNIAYVAECIENKGYEVETRDYIIRICW